MTESADVIIPSFSRDAVNGLPLYYRAMAEHLAETGRAIIKDTSEKQEKTA